MDERSATRALRIGQVAALTGVSVDALRYSDGWALELDPSPEAFLGAAAWITLERLCCPFLEFDLGWSPARDRVQLRLTGSEAAKQAVGAALGRRPSDDRQGGSDPRLA